tara:strand:- start:182 stop:310 length:129 start_codon:yes stop_codon:yes gene_type:complete
LIKNKNFWILLMIIVPLIGLLFKVYALLLVLPLGFALGKKSK